MLTLSQMFDSFDTFVKTGSKNDFISEHYAFYLRGVLNSVNPVHRASSKLITEDDVSGEYLEAMRLVANTYAKDLKDGEFVNIGYADVRRALGDAGDYWTTFEVDSMADTINNTLGKFNIRNTKGQLHVDYDTYDFPTEFEDRFLKEEGRSATAMDYIKEAVNIAGNDKLYSSYREKIHRTAHLAGEFIMPDTADDNLKVRIAIPSEPQVIDIDFDNDIEPTATDVVFEGPMTNKRKQIWDRFSNIFIGEAQATEPSMPLPTSKPEMGDRGEPEVDIALPTSKPQQPQQQTFLSQIRNQVRESKEVM